MQIPKNPGDSLGCHISFEHRGEAITVWAGFALCEHPHTPVWVFSAFSRMDIPAHTEWTRVSSSPESTIASDCPAAIYDSRVVVATSAPMGALPPEGSWVLRKWDYNVVEVIGGPAPPPEKAEFRALETGPYGNRQGELVPTITPVAPPVPPPPPPPPPAELVVSDTRIVPFRDVVAGQYGAELSFRTNKEASGRFRHRSQGYTEAGNYHGWLYSGPVGTGTSFKIRILNSRSKGGVEWAEGRHDIQPVAEAGAVRAYGDIVGFDFTRVEVISPTPPLPVAPPRIVSQRIEEFKGGVRLIFSASPDCEMRVMLRRPGAATWGSYPALSWTGYPLRRDFRFEIFSDVRADPYPRCCGHFEFLPQARMPGGAIVSGNIMEGDCGGIPPPPTPPGPPPPTEFAIYDQHMVDIPAPDGRREPAGVKITFRASRLGFVRVLCRKAGATRWDVLPEAAWRDTIRLRVWYHEFEFYAKGYNPFPHWGLEGRYEFLPEAQWVEVAEAGIFPVPYVVETVRGTIMSFTFVPK